MAINPLKFSTGGGGMSSKSSSALTDMSSVAQGGDTYGPGVGAVSIDGGAAATLSKPWWMGGAGWQSDSPAAATGGNVAPAGGESADTEGEGRDLGDPMLWAVGGLAALGLGVAAFAMMRGG